MKLRVKATASSATGAFFVTAALSAVAGMLLFVRSVDSEAQVGDPVFLAAVHAFLLGGVGSVYFGASHQLYPVVSEQRLRVSAGWAWSHLLLHLAGLILMIPGFALQHYGWVAAGGTLVLLGASFLCVRALIALERRCAWNPESIGFFLAFCWLLMAMALGLWMAAFRLGFVDLPLDAVRGFHLRMAFGGFFLNLLFGLSHRLVPMFLVARKRGTVGAAAALVLLNSGLILGGIGLMGPLPIATQLGDGLLSLSVGGYGYATIAQVRTRLRPMGGSFISYVLGVSGLALCAAWALVNILGNAFAWDTPLADLPTWMPLAMAVPLALLPIIFGVSARIIPFLAWQSVCAPFLGKRKLPLVQALWSERLIWAESILLASGWLLCLMLIQFREATVWRYAILVFLLPLAFRGWNCLTLFNRLRAFRRECTLS